METGCCIFSAFKKCYLGCLHTTGSTTAATSQSIGVTCRRCRLHILVLTHRCYVANLLHVQRSQTSSFSQVPIDQALEQSINRDTKSQGGIIGFTLSPGAVDRWMLTIHLCAAFTAACNTKAGLCFLEPTHQALQKSSIQRNLDALKKVEETLQSWVNLLAESDGLFSLSSSGVLAPAEVEHDLIHAHEKGREAMVSFFRNRLLSSKINFYDTLHAMSLKTFSSLCKSTPVATGERQAVVRADWNLFARLAMVAQTRNLNMRQVLSYELGPLPLSIASPDGGLAKTAKSKLLPLLEGSIPAVEDIPSTATLLVDGMATLQTTIVRGGTFADMARQVFTQITSGLLPGGRVDFVVDQYRLESIKNLERQNRSVAGGLLVKINRPDQKLPSWKKYLAVSANKVAVVEFLLAQWKEPQYAARLLYRSLYVCHGNQCDLLTSLDGLQVLSFSVEALTSSQEEADTRLFLHAHHAAQNGASTIIISSPIPTLPCLGVPMLADCSQPSSFFTLERSIANAS